MMKPSDIRHLALLAASLLATTALAQVAQPSNSTTDLYPIATSPRFLLNGTEFPHLAPISLAPLGPYASITKSDFLDVSISERLINVDASNSDQPLNNQIAYISCDPQAYDGYITASQVFDNVLTLAASDSPNSLIIVYSVYSNHCNVSDLSNSPQINGVLTTVDPVAAAALAKLNLSSSSKGSALILPDLKSYTNASSNGQSGGSNLLGPSPTTAVAMIILYSITGIITALFIIIIITGAIRAHRHPERYGPRNIIGRPRQSRAKGIARAMLETLPIVKFGDHDDVPVKPGSSDGTAAVGAAGTDIEMNPTTTHDATRTKSPADEADADADAGTEQKDMHHGDGTQEDGSLGCSICTEDFTRGEEVRVLPCNHKFHPDCVDPWLLNVSGTCPLCRINLQPKTEEADAEAEPEANSGSAVPGEEGPIRGREGDDLPPPLALNALEGNAFSQTGGSNRHGSLSLGLTSGTREERLAALRRLRADRRERTRNHAAANENGDVLGEGAGAPEVQTEAERRGLTARLRDRFRIRTRTVSDGEWRNRGARAENGIGARSIVTLNRHAR